jgi:hypothetical protein
MIQLCIARLRYPDWYVISKKNSDNEEEECYLELRKDLIQFLDPLVKFEHFKNFIT